MKHPFLNQEMCVSRLIDDYEKHGSIVIAYDFDNTVFDFHSNGFDYTDIISLLRELRSTIECCLIVFTANDDIGFIKSYLNKNNIPFDLINENPSFFDSKSRKIYYNILLDDRAGLLSAYLQLKELLRRIKK